MKQRSGQCIVGGIVLIALSAAIVQAFVWESWPRLANPLSDPDNFQTRRAVSLLTTGTFNFREVGFVSLQGLRGPAYPIVLAFAFLITRAATAWPVYILNALFFAGAIMFLWLFAKRFLSGLWQFLPPFMLAVFWEATSLVVVPSYEIFSLSVALGSLEALFRYRDTAQARWLAVAACGIAIWTLERPVMLYALPFLFLIMLIWQAKRLSVRSLGVHLGIVAALLALLVGSWSYHNYTAYGTWQLGSAGPILLRRASQVDFSSRELISMALSFSVGDFIGSRIYAHYPADAEPKTWDPEIERRLERTGFYRSNWYVTDDDGSVLTRVAFEQRLMREAKEKMRARPVIFFLTGFINMLRLNAPVNYGGQEMMHLFVDSHEQFAAAVKIAIIAAIRLAWLAFVLIALFALCTHWYDWWAWSVPAFLIMYYNGMHVFFTHAEVRYLLTAMPLYFLFFVEGLRLLTRKYF